MTEYKLENFWKQILTVKPCASPTFIKGWSYVDSGLDTFLEAPLTKSLEFGGATEPSTSPLILVSAPGAVGKSTLARQIAFETNAVYVNLASADPVGANTISGGLVKSGLYPAWQAGETGLLIDGIDEARLRVTQEGLDAFLADVAEVSKGRSTPTVLFGRSGAIQDAWATLFISGIEVPVLEIGYYSEESSVEFTCRLLPESSHGAVYRQAVELMLAKLRAQTESDGDRFAGYAPVLQAVAKRVEVEGNPAAFISQIEKGEQTVTLSAIVSAILERERTKLQPLHFDDPALVTKLYLADEQLDHLVSRVYSQQPPPLPPMSPKDSATYSTALKTWVGEHPFLGICGGASSAVFDAVIANRALSKSSSSNLALERELQKGAAANPFLAEFYLAETTKTNERFRVPLEHVGMLYSSLRSTLAIGDSACLTIEGGDVDSDEDSLAALEAQVEVSLARRNSDKPRSLIFDSDQTTVIRLGPHIQDVDIDAPHSTVELGLGTETVLVSPVSILCESFRLNSERLIIEACGDTRTAAVYIQALNYKGERLASVPSLRGDVSLAVSWPESSAYPWTSFSSTPTTPNNPKVNEALRRFRKFVVSFRSHSKGALARYQHKIEHERMTKGTGQEILDLLVRNEILTLDRSRSQYFLDPDRLASIAGTNYLDCMAHRFGEKAISFVQQVTRT